jgi:transcriptional regulator with XRE-family HTH domain
MQGTIDLAEARRAAPPVFRDLLRHWRGVRRMSQLALATEAEISARHLCFLETGRAQPSREMVQLLGGVLDLPFAEQNTLLLAAGYAPVYGERELAAPELGHVQRALDFMLRQQEPYPAIVIDAAWNVRMRNDASRRLLRPFREQYDMPPELAENAMHVVCHPKGMRPFLVNWEAFVGPLIQTVHREADQGANPAAARLRDQLLTYPGIPRSWRTPDASAASPLLTMQLKRGDYELAFFTTLTTFALPRDVTLQQLRIEGFFPADDATAETARRLAAAA